jgi:hypothetical protein
MLINDRIQDSIFPQITWRVIVSKKVKSMTGPSNDAVQVFYGTLPLLGGIMLAAWNNNKRLDHFNKRLDDLKTSLSKQMNDMNTALNKRINDLVGRIDSGFQQVNERIGKLEDRVTDIEKGMRLVRWDPASPSTNRPTPSTLKLRLRRPCSVRRIAKPSLFSIPVPRLLQRL